MSSVYVVVSTKGSENHGGEWPVCDDIPTEMGGKKMLHVSGSKVKEYDFGSWKGEYTTVDVAGNGAKQHAGFDVSQSIGEDCIFGQQSSPSSVSIISRGEDIVSECIPGCPDCIEKAITTLVFATTKKLTRIKNDTTRCMCKICRNHNVPIH